MYQREHFFRLVKNGLEVVFSLISENQNAETLQFDLSKCEKLELSYSSPCFTGRRVLTTQKYTGNYYEIVGENKIKIILSNLKNASYLLNGVAFYGSYTLSICSLQIDVPSNVSQGIQDLGTITQVVVKSFEIGGGGGGGGDATWGNIGGNINDQTDLNNEFVRKSTFLNTLYPTGTILMTYSKISPATYIGGEWELIEEGYYPVSTVQNTIEARLLNAELPNIKGSWGGAAARNMRDIKGAFTGTTVIQNGASWGGSGNNDHITITPFDASNGQVNEDGKTYVPQEESVYKNGGKVQPKSILLYMWRRVDNGALTYNFVNISFSENDFIVNPTTGQISLRNAIYYYTPNNIPKADNTGKLVDSGININDIVLKTRKVAGCDLEDDITAQEIQDAIKELTATLKHKSMSADDNTFTDFTPNEFKSSAKKEGSSNNDKFTTQGYVDDEIAKVVATLDKIDDLETNYYYAFKNGSNYIYIKTKTIGTNKNTYLFTYTESVLTKIELSDKKSEIKLNDSGNLIAVYDSNNYTYDTTKDNYYVIDPTDKTSSIQASIIDKDTSRCFEDFYIIPPNEGWRYVGILPATDGATLKVEDDWNELLIISRVQEGSNYYNLINVIPKVAFTQGSPTNNEVMTGFYWNVSFHSKTRIGITGTGSNRVVKKGYTDQTGWAVAEFYIYKR